MNFSKIIYKQNNSFNPVEKKKINLIIYLGIMANNFIGSHKKVPKQIFFLIIH